MEKGGEARYSNVRKKGGEKGEKSVKRFAYAMWSHF